MSKKSLIEEDSRENLRGKLGNDNVKIRVSNNFAVKENNKYIGRWRVIVGLEIFLKVAKIMPFFVC